MKLYTYSGLYETNKGFWIPIKDSSAVYFINENGESEYIGMLDGGSSILNQDIAKVVAINDNVYFFSRIGYEVWKYNRVTHNIEYIKYYDQSIDCILFVAQIENQVWVFPNNFSGVNKPVLQINIEKFEVRETDWKLSENIGDSAISQVICYKKQLLFAGRKKDDIRLFNIDTEKNDIKQISIEDARYINCIEVDKDKLYILYRTKYEKTVICIMTRDGKKEEVFDISKYVPFEDSLKNSIFRIIKRDNRLLLIYYDKNQVDIIDCTKGLDSYRTIKGEIQVENKSVCNDIQICQNAVYLYSPECGFLQRFDWKTEELVDLKIEICDKEIAKYIKEKNSKGKIITETEGVCLKDFLKVVSV